MYPSMNLWALCTFYKKLMSAKYIFKKLVSDLHLRNLCALCIVQYILQRTYKHYPTFEKKPMSTTYPSRNLWALSHFWEKTYARHVSCKELVSTVPLLRRTLWALSTTYPSRNFWAYCILAKKLMTAIYPWRNLWALCALDKKLMSAPYHSRNLPVHNHILFLK